ncbi:MAG: 6-phosphogluconolactonase [Candidatus Levybacteria bacterium]|nr:6-phosphogluconolactonase [Candidatus Levybacteria bacterium]
MKIIKVKDAGEGVDKAKSFIYKYSNSQTALFLSGGLTPKALYQTLSTDKKLKAGAVAVVDERFGLPFHDNSNEKMIKDSHLFEYLKSTNTLVFTVLNGKDIDNTTKDYEKIISRLFKSYKQKIAILGIGEDGHTAGIPKGYYNSNELVIKIDDFPSEFRKRITLTFKALEQMDRLIVLVFGENKKKVLNEMFKKGLLEELPARFYLQKEISQKTILITDQAV